VRRILSEQGSWAWWHMPTQALSSRHASSTVELLLEAFKVCRQQQLGIERRTPHWRKQVDKGSLIVLNSRLAAASNCASGKAVVRGGTCTGQRLFVCPNTAAGIARSSTKQQSSS
jgi:hypothetical protein